MWIVYLFLALFFSALGPVALNATEAPQEEIEQKAEPPFQPPPLEELEDVKWIPQRVGDGMVLLRERLKKLPPPLPDGEALKLRNTDRETNEKIVPAMGRLPASDDEVDWNATLNFCLMGTPKTLNTLLQSTLYEGIVTSTLYSGVFTIDQDMNPIADRDTVVEWHTSEDNLINKVRLRDDVTWSDGAPFTARDVEFTFKTIMSKKVRCPSAYTHAMEFRGVKAYDDRTLVFFHKKPLATNVWDLNFPILPKHKYEPTLAKDPTMVASEENRELNKNPVSSGPYRRKSWEDDVIVCERRPEWYERDGKRLRSKPFFKTIRFRIIQNRSTALLEFKAGNLDLMELTAEQWQNHTGETGFYARGTKMAGAEWSNHFIAWNQKPIPDAPFFKDRRVREAMSLTFPHEEFLKEVCYGLNPQALGIFPPRSWMADPGLEPLQQDLARATKLLQEAGWNDSDGDGLLDKTIGGKKVPFRFTFQIPIGNPMYEDIARLLKRDLELLGVACDVRQLEWATFITSLREHRFQAASLGWMNGVHPDTSRNIWTTEAYDNGRNYTGYSNPRVDELFRKGQLELDREERVKIYHQIDRIVTRDYPFTMLQIRLSQYAVSRDLRGLNFSPRGPFSFTPGFFSLWKIKKNN